jgi:RsiW-degrading membrane proteinase PrsW (M82 family)
MTESKAVHERKHVWRNEFLLIISLIVFVGVVYALDGALKPVFTTSTLLLTGVFLALIPAAIWLVFFYMQDRLEPEPKGYVLGVFALGALFAAAIGQPVIENVFRVSHWIYTNTLATILGGILVVGFTQEFLKYAAVRYSVYPSNEFDEATDGVIYATAAGLGYATVLNIQFVLSNGGVDLGTGVIRMAIVALAQASFSGITGYFLGRAKFESEQVWWMPLGITLAAVFNGLFNWLRGLVVQTNVSLSGAAVNPWPGLVLAAAVAFVTTGAVLWLVRRNLNSVQAGK